MSRIGKKPIVLPSGVQVTEQASKITVKGPKGTLNYTLPPHISLEQKEGKLHLRRKEESVAARSLHGVSQTTLQNMVKGVVENFSKDLEIQGVGYRAEVKGKNLQLSLGFSHPVLFPIPEGIVVKVASQTQVEIIGCDKVLVGQVAATIRKLRPPEPYQGKGIRYKGEVVRRKVGKAAAGAAGA